MKACISHLGAAGLCFMIMAVTSLTAGPKGNGKPVAAPTVHVVQASATSSGMYFSAEHVRVIREYYKPQHRSLPPGLQKKYARTGQLPPGWQKKMEPLPVAIERDLPRLPDGYRRGVIEGRAVVYSSRAGTIIDVAVVF